MVSVAGAFVGAVRVPARPVHDAAAIERIRVRRPFRLPPIFRVLLEPEAQPRRPPEAPPRQLATPADP